MDAEESASDFNSNTSNSKSKSETLSQIVEEKDDSDEYQDGVEKSKDLFVHGLYIEWAQWDYEKECLVEAKTRILNYAMPAFKVKVISHEEFQLKFHNDEYFDTPLFKISLREVNILDGECFVMHVPLKISNKTKPDFWLKRSTALFWQMNM